MAGTRSVDDREVSAHARPRHEIGPILLTLCDRRDTHFVCLDGSAEPGSPAPGVRNRGDRRGELPGSAVSRGGLHSEPLVGGRGGGQFAIEDGLVGAVEIQRPERAGGDAQYGYRQHRRGRTRAPPQPGDRERQPHAEVRTPAHRSPPQRAGVARTRDDNAWRRARGRRRPPWRDLRRLVAPEPSGPSSVPFTGDTRRAAVRRSCGLLGSQTWPVSGGGDRLAERRFAKRIRRHWRGGRPRCCDWPELDIADRVRTTCGRRARVRAWISLAATDRNVCICDRARAARYRAPGRPASIAAMR